MGWALLLFCGALGFGRTPWYAPSVVVALGLAFRFVVEWHDRGSLEDFSIAAATSSAATALILAYAAYGLGRLFGKWLNVAPSA